MSDHKIMPVEHCGHINKCMASPSSYMDRLSGYGEKTIARAAALALASLESARAKDVAQHEANVPALVNNKAIADQIIALNEAVGMPKRWTERDRNSRARYPKIIGHDAGYLSDLAREVKTDDGFESATSTYNRLKAEYDRYAESGKAEAEQIARKREIEQMRLVERRKADMELAGLLLRYELPIESSWSDVLAHLCEKDQRINLAVAMEQTRGDWSDGPYRVRDALTDFIIQTDEDKEIAADVASELYDFEDGRCFRDCTWNYSRLFASVADQQLAADAQTAAAHRGDA